MPIQMLESMTGLCRNKTSIALLNLTGNEIDDDMLKPLLKLIRNRDIPIREINLK
jgi:hypothetical protein